MDALDIADVASTPHVEEMKEGKDRKEGTGTGGGDSKGMAYQMNVIKLQSLTLTLNFIRTLTRKP